MKKILLIIPCFLFITFSCSKDDSSSSTNPLFGKWKIISVTEDVLNPTTCTKTKDTVITIASTDRMYQEVEIIENDSIYNRKFNPAREDVIDYFLVGDSKFYTYANSIEGDTFDYKFENNNNTLLITGYHNTSCGSGLVKKYSTEKFTRIK